MLVEKGQISTLATTYGVKVVGMLALLAAAWWVAGYTRTAVRATLSRARFDVTLTRFFANAARWAILVFAGVSALGIFGVQAASFAAVIAAVGLAVGLGFQGTLSNFAAGVMLLVFRPFGVGDTVKVGGQSGTVDEIDLFTTTLDTPDRRRVIIPNSMIAGATIENVTFHGSRRVDVDVQTESRHAIALVRMSLLAAISPIESSPDQPAPAVVLTNVTAAATDWQIQIYAASSRYGAVRESILEAVRGVLLALPPPPPADAPGPSADDVAAAMKVLVAQASAAVPAH
jgi:small conductance mechanosensitive channel